MRQNKVAGQYNILKILKFRMFTLHTFLATLKRLPMSLTSVSLNVILKSFLEPSDIVRRGKLPALDIPEASLSSDMCDPPNSEHVPDNEKIYINVRN